MHVTLYNLTEDLNTYPKPLSTPVGVLECKLKDAQNVMNPTLMLSAQDLPVFNYAALVFDDRTRYYFVDRPKSIIVNGVYAFMLQQDCLMTFYNEVMQEDGIIMRQQNSANLYLADPDFPVEARKEQYFKQFPAGFDTAFTYYLTVGG